MKGKDLSYRSGTSTMPLIGMTIGDKLDETVKKYPHREALVVKHQDIRWTYSELSEHIDTTAKALMASGLEKGDRVGLWSPNRYEWVVMQFATAKAGVIMVNINPAYRSHELKYVLNLSGCKILVASHRFKTSDYAKIVLELAPEITWSTYGNLQSKELPALKGVVLLSDNPPDGFMSWGGLNDLSEKVTDEDLASRQSSLSCDDPISILFTSGTTGSPKGATLSHHGLLNNGVIATSLMGFSEKTRLVIPLPLYHIFAMVVGSLGITIQGGTAIYPSEGFEPLATLQAAQDEKATAMYGVPTMFIAQLDHPDFGKFNLEHLKGGMMGGSPCPIEVMKKVKSLMNMTDIQIGYGLTETSPAVAQTRIGSPLEKQVSTIGEVHPHVEVKIIDEQTGQIVPVGQSGELCTRGYLVMLGYWEDEERTNIAIDSSKWLHTGDLAVMDDEGYISISGRIKDMIIRGGENIYPREIEEYFYTNPKISDVQVIGIPSAKLGEEVMAWVKLKEGESATPEELQAFCKGKIAHYKIPKYFKFTEDFPMTVTGKIRKVEMRSISIKELQLEKVT